MAGHLPKSLTIEEAVALMVNLDYIPEGVTLEEMLSAFQEEVDVAHYNAKLEKKPEKELTALGNRVKICDIRCSLATSLMIDLNNEIQALKDNQASLIELSKDAGSRTRITYQSLSLWAGYSYGIGVEAPIYESEDKQPVAQSWSDVTISLNANNMIESSFSGSGTHIVHLSEVGLMGKKKHSPNQTYGILFALAKGIKFPTAVKPNGKDRKAISALRSSLQQLTNIDGDPFQFANDLGWKPLFKLKDCTKKAQERAEQEAIHESYTDELSCTDEMKGDHTDQWLEEQLNQR